MSTDTANYGFTKDNEDDFYNVNVVNANLDKIDTEMKRIENTIPTPTDSVKWLGTVAGTTNALTVTHAAITSYSDGLGVSFAANANSSAATTLNINGLGAIPIKNSKGTAVSNLKTNGVYTARYRAGAFILQGEGGGYGVGETIRAMDVINRSYIQTNVPVQNVGYYAYAAGAVATINGEEYAFARRNSTRDSQMVCWNTRTGFTMWRRSVAYDWATSIQVVGDRLYIGYYDYDNVAGGGVGLETMIALTGQRLKMEKATVPLVSAANAVYNIAVTFNGPTKEITVLCGWGSGTYYFLCRYNLDGTFLASSGDLKGVGLDEYPFYIVGVDTRTFVASYNTIYMFGSVGLGYAGKTSAFSGSYVIGGIAPNNTGGLCMLHTSGILYNYTTSLVAGPQLSIASNAVGLTTQGDWLGVVSAMTLSLYKFAADGKSISSEAAASYQNDYNTSYVIKSLGVSENAFVVPTRNSQLEPPVLTRTLKILR
ncbi:hypothetical protein [Lysinibacillus sp. OF-1]|uniref:hypothetical protein n=1 Tax=Lysinibacillus sp. OF-1 TaxID=2972483 RepID=UPI00232EAD84|nr:hypothetical protein [Lysinibacillus sp. OF-1]WCH49012.1 hypothetical protein NV349_06405 [Lysinibacillus sp. OF-1]